ncbi:beta strand repeat-containing protein [Aeromonas media]|uniref:beta strand repeat-containing protein n=2 Tax=Aeromonas media TaxID=651 RepID=UPI00384E4A8D
MTKMLRSYVALLFSFLLLGCSSGSEDTTPETSPSLEQIHIVANPISTRGSSSLILAKGNTQPFIATGHYDDGSVKDLTSETSWHSSDSRIATMSSPGALTARDTGTTTVTASHDGITSNTVQVTVTDATLTAIQVTPPSVSLAKGQTRQLTATATYSDNTTADISGNVTWLPTDITTATVSTTGLLTGRVAGTTELTASLDGINSNRVQVTVTDATLTAIQVTPPSVSLAKGQTRQLTATATYSDNTTADISGNVTWLPTDITTATVSTTGLLTGRVAGTTELSASLNGINSNRVQVTVTDATLTAIQVTPPNVSLIKGQTQQLTATATYSDNTTADVTGHVTWLSDDAATATITATGLLTGVEQGSAEVTASLDGVTGNAVQVTVTDAILTAIQITPPSVSVGKGQTQQLTATATYSDNTTANVTNGVAWLSDDAATATITATGLLTGVEQGIAEVTASLDGITGNTIQVTVTDAILTAIQVTPPSVSLAKGQTRQLTATAIYSDNTTADISSNASWVTWLLNGTAAATVSSTGLLTGMVTGITEATAHQDRITSNIVDVTVTDAILTAIEITPPSVSVGKGQTQQLTATATYSDNSTADVTSSVAWLSDDAATATITPNGLLTGVEQGTTEVTASLDGVTSDRVTVNVVVISLFDTFEDVSVNGFTFAVDAGFPTTGFYGAEFVLNAPETASDYTWNSDAPWVSVDNSGTVRFISQGDASPVTITATPTSGGTSLAYTFTITSWFRSNGSSRVTYSEARTWCNEQQPSYQWKIPAYRLLSQAPATRGVGALWREWGDMMNYGNSTFTWRGHWSSTTVSTGNYYFVYLDSGNVNWIAGSNNTSNAAICALTL